jgi:hypothetical protein
MAGRHTMAAPSTDIRARVSADAIVAAAIALISLIPAFRAGGEEGMAFFVVGLHLGGILCMANIVLAFIALSRHENPRWPAVTGLALSVLPALGEVYLLCGAPW